MTYFCFLQSESGVLPHMEPLDAESLEEAIREALQLLEDHGSAVAARICLNEVEVAVVEPSQRRQRRSNRSTSDEGGSPSPDRISVVQQIGPDRTRRWNDHLRPHGHEPR